MQAPHRQDRKPEWAEVEKMPALRRQSGIGPHRSGDPVQRQRLVRHRLRTQDLRRRRLEIREFGKVRKAREIRKILEARLQVGALKGNQEDLRVKGKIMCGSIE